MTSAKPRSYALICQNLIIPDNRKALNVRPPQLNLQANSVQTSRTAQNDHRIPELWLPALRAHLPDSETVLATIEVDLDSQLQFAHGLVCLTDKSLYALSHTGEWSQWALSPDQTLKLSDHAGIATLDLLSPNGRLACWRFTLAQNPSALRLVRQLDSLREKHV